MGEIYRISLMLLKLVGKTQCDLNRKTFLFMVGKKKITGKSIRAYNGAHMQVQIKINM